VREAFVRLEAEGFLQILPKKGAYVPAISEPEVAAVMEARVLVEEWCARRAAQSDDNVVAELRVLLREQEHLRDDPVAFIERDREFHRALVRSAGNPFVADFYESLRDRQLRMGLHAIVAVAGRTGIVLAEHATIVDAIDARDPERAAAAMKEHLAKTLVALRAPERAGWRRNAQGQQGLFPGKGLS
jgi:DNA-binding GntR family transcriptional regulator